MKLKEALKKFPFLKKLNIPDEKLAMVAAQLVNTLKGFSEVHITPLARENDPIVILCSWDIIFQDNKHLLNSTLYELECSSRSKFGPRSIAVPWSERMDSIKTSFSCQQGGRSVKLYSFPAPGYLSPISIPETATKMKFNTSSGLPFLTKKNKSQDLLLSNFNDYLERKDPCMLYTRTQESKKTRNVWGFPFADTFLEIMFYVPLLEYQRTLPYRSALVGPEEVARSITGLILKARDSNRVIYSIDFAGFDASVWYQLIIEAFNYFKRCFAPQFHTFLDYVCERCHSIAIVTPSGIYTGNHGVPSGSGFTNEVDSVVQVGLALNCEFIKEDECQVQGDDGVYILKEEEISEFAFNFTKYGLKPELSKSAKSKDFAIFCQNLYHIDYLNDGHIGGIYPIYRALNRLLFQERFQTFKKYGIKGRDYYGIRTLSILENCKYHPLFEEFVRFVVKRDKYSLEVSDEGLDLYCKMLELNDSTVSSLNHQYGSDVRGLRSFESYKLALKFANEEMAEEVILPTVPVE